MATHTDMDEDRMIKPDDTALAELDPAARCQVLNVVPATVGVSAPETPVGLSAFPRPQTGFRLSSKNPALITTTAPNLFSGLHEAVTLMHSLRSGSVWGGSDDRDAEVQTPGLQGSLYAASCNGRQGGDIYYLSVGQVGELTRMVLAEVTGPSEAVSMIRHVLYGVLTGYLNEGASQEVLTLVNQIVAGHASLATATAVVVTYHRADEQLAFTSAGDLPILVKSPNQSVWRAAEPSQKAVSTLNSGLPLGVASDTSYLLDTMGVEVGSRLCLYAHGLTESRNTAGECFGIQRLQSVLQLYAEAPLRQVKQAVLEAVQNHTEGTAAHDDITVLITELN